VGGAALGPAGAVGAAGAEAPVGALGAGANWGAAAGAGFDSDASFAVAGCFGAVWALATLAASDSTQTLRSHALAGVMVA
jgi:hypothetical protein